MVVFVKTEALRRLRTSIQSVSEISKTSDGIAVLWRSSLPCVQIQRACGRKFLRQHASLREEVSESRVDPVSRSVLVQSRYRVIVSLPTSIFAEWETLPNTASTSVWQMFSAVRRLFPNGSIRAHMLWPGPRPASFCCASLSGCADQLEWRGGRDGLGGFLRN